MDIVETTSTVIAGHENSTCPSILDEWFSDAGQVEILKSVNAFFYFLLNLRYVVESRTSCDFVIVGLTVTYPIS